MNDSLLIWSSMILIAALLAAMAIHTPNTFLLDTIRRLFSHGHPFNR